MEDQAVGALSRYLEGGPDTILRGWALVTAVLLILALLLTLVAGGYTFEFIDALRFPTDDASPVWSDVLPDLCALWAAAAGAWRSAAITSCWIRP